MNPRIRQAIREALLCGNTRQAAAEAAVFIRGVFYLHLSCVIRDDHMS